MRWMRLWALLLAFFLALCTTAQLTAADGDRGGPVEDQVQLRQWLQQLRIEVPAFQVPVWILDHLGIHVFVTRGACWHIQVQSIQVPAANGTARNLQFSLDLSGISVTCDLLVDVTWWGRFESGVEVSLSVTDAGATAQLGIASDGEMPTSAALDRCSLRFHLAKLAFKGKGLMPAGLKAAEPLIRLALEHSTRFICRRVEDLMRTSGSHYMLEVADLLRPLLQPAPPLSWQPVAGAADLRKFFWSGPLGTLLRSGLLQVAHTDNTVLFNDFLMRVLVSLKLLENNTVLHLPRVAEALRTNVSVPFTNGTVVLHGWLNSLAVDLLDSFRSVEAGIEHNVVNLTGGIAPGASIGGSIALVLPEGSAQFSIGGLDVKLAEHAALAPVRLSMSCRTSVDSKIRTLALFDPHTTSSLQLDQLQRQGCLSHALTPANMSLGFVEANANATLLGLQVMFPELSEASLEDQLRRTVATIASAANVTFGDTIIRLIAGALSGIGRDYANAWIEKVLPASPSTYCAPSHFSDGHVAAIDYPARGCIVLCLLVAALLIIKGIWSSRTQVSQNDSRDSFRTAGSASAQSGLLDIADCVSSEPGRVALGRHPAIPVTLRAVMPWLIVGNTFLFVVAAFTPAVLVTVIATKPNAPEWLSPGIVVISINNTLGGMLKSKVYLLWFLVVAFSVVWPYVKLLTMLYLWLRPLDEGRRGRILVFLDQVGKWSLADNFIMMLLFVFFYVSWRGADTTQPEGETSPGSTSIEIKCLPKLEFYAFIVGTICSLVLGHAMLAAHRVAHGKWYHKATLADRKEPLWRAALRPCAGARIPPALVAIGVTVFLLATLLLVVAALFVPVVVLDFGGIIGTFLDVTGQPRRTRSSLATITGNLIWPQEAPWLAGVVIFFMGMLPLLLHVALLLLWLLPLRSRFRLGLFTSCQTFAAWACLDVAAVAVLGAVFGGDNYGISAFLNMVVYEGTVAPLCDSLRDYGGLECLTTHLELLPTYWVLFAAAAASLVASQVVFKAVHISQQESHSEESVLS